MSEPNNYIMNYSGLCAILSEVSKTYTSVFIENLSDNGKLITSIIEQNHIPAYIESTSWYYLYNYHIRTKAPSEVLLLCLVFSLSRIFSCFNKGIEHEDYKYS